MDNTGACGDASQGPVFLLIGPVMISFNKNSSKDEAFRFYTANADGVIRESVELLMKKGPRHDISEEIALFKMSMLNRVELYQAAIKSGKPAAIDKAADLLQDGLRAVADMVRIQAQLDSLSKDKYTIDQVETLIHRIMDVVFLVCTSDQATKIENQVRKETEITLKPRGVTFTPSDDVSAMIDSVPHRN